METHYTHETSAQMLIALMKEHGIKKVIASPGTTNIAFVASIQSDPFFEVYSSVDERSAAYMACGLAAESGEAVAISCTGATASRNYPPGLTEAFYRKLPVLAITASQPIGRAGRGFPQMLDRSSPMKDIAKISVTVDPVHDSESRWSAELLINEALLELRHQGGGPVHINMVTTYDRDFSIENLPSVRKINRFFLRDALPELPLGKTAIFVGAHLPFSDSLTRSIDAFCMEHNAVVLCDQTSNYRGQFRILANLLAGQDKYHSALLEVDTLIHIGEISGSYMRINPRRVWRVNPDGKLIDPFRKLHNVFEMDELDFFEAYSKGAERSETSYYEAMKNEVDSIRAKIPDLPFSNAWCAQCVSKMLPERCYLHLGILNSLRSWNFFETPNTTICWSNTGGFGIDGSISSLLGSAMANPNVLHFAVVGDLAFFYDMNALGNRHLPANIRLIVVNNGRGVEFRNYSHIASIFGANADTYIAAAGHYGNKSQDLLQHYAQDLGLEYMTASSKEELLLCIDQFLNPKISNTSILLEIFTETEDEIAALRMLNNIETSGRGVASDLAKQAIRNVLGEKGVRVAKKLTGR